LAVKATATWFAKEKVAPVGFELKPGEIKTLQLRSGKWLLRAESRGYWGSPLQLDLAAGSAAPITLDLWPAGEIQGGLTLPPGEEPPAEVAIFFRPSKGAVQAELLPPPDQVVCPVRKRSWECVLPAGVMDLRVQAAGYVPRYLWAATIPRGKTLRPGSLALHRGSAVLGWVVTADGSPLGDQAAVELRPRAGGQVHNAEERERLAALVFKSKVNRQGFFQLDGVPPGAYIIEARLEPFAPAMASVRVVPNQVTELSNPPLVLEPPKVLELFIDPPIDPAGHAWTMRLHRLDRGSSVLTEVAALQATGADGSWKLPGLAPGNYYLRIGRRNGDTWWVGEVEVTPDLAPLEVRLGVIKVVGSVRLGKTPLASKLYIGEHGGRHAAVRVEVETDEEGELETFLPKAGVWTIHVSAKEPPVEREIPQVVIEPKPGTSEAEIDLRLPNTKLAGKVVDAQGEPIARAIVNAKSVGGAWESLVQAWTDAEGRFSFSGLPAGPTLVEADAGEDLRADAVLVEVTETEEPAPLTLVAEARLRLEGVVASEAGPVSGARVRVAPVGLRHLGLVRTVTTDTQGRFKAFLPPAAGEAQITVAAPGFAFRMLRLRIPGSRMVPILVHPEAGTLVIEAAQAFEPLDPSKPGIFVLRSGALVGLSTLRGWAATTGSLDQDGSKTVVPLVEPGEYRACWAMAAEREALELGAPPSGPCASGSLAASGELILKLGPPRR
jgi:hypothetical protein